MSTLTQRTKVQSTAAPFKWPTVGEYGFVPTDSVVVSPYNSRKWYDPAHVQELAESMKEDGQLEIATVRELTADEIATTYPNARYMLVSGEQRWHSAKAAELEFFEVRVREYRSRAFEKLHGYMLNERRKPISDLEHAWALQDLFEEFGWKTHKEALAHLNDRDEAWISTTLSLLKLSPLAQGRMHPRIKPEERLAKTVGNFLSRFQHDVQDMLLKELPDDVKTAEKQVSSMRRRLDEKGVEVPHNQRDPSTMRKILQRFAANLEEKATAFGKAPEFPRLFENTSDEAAEELAVNLRNALVAFEKVVEAVEQYASAEKRLTTLIPPKAKPAVEKAPDAPLTARRSPPPAPEPSHPRPSPIAPSSARSQGCMVTVDYQHENGRMTMEKVDLRRYCELHDAKRLKYQINGTDKPQHYPDRAQIFG